MIGLAILLAPACLPLSNQLDGLAWPGPTLVTNQISEAHDSFALCQLDGDAWACEDQVVPGMAGILSSYTLGLEAMDTDGDGATGFVIYGKTIAYCEPRPDGWLCGQTGHTAQKIQIVDLNGDGLDDLAYADRNVGSFACYAGTFPMACEMVTPFDTAYGWEATAWADFDGDGDLDLFGAFEDFWDVNSSQICYSDPDGWDCRRFDHVELAARGLNTDAVALDADRDGALDLYLAGGVDYSGDNALCLNAGGGSFDCVAVDLVDVYEGAHALGDSSLDLEVVDLDGDGAEDLLMHGRGDASVCWSDGAGGLDCAPLDPEGSWERDSWDEWNQIDAADLDGDGLPDVVKSGAAGDEGVEFCVNLGDRRFACEAVLEQERSVAAAILAP